MPNGLSPQQILNRFDRIPVWPFSNRVLVVVGFGFFFAFFDIVTIGFALPVLIKQFHVTEGAASWAITSSLIGYIVGSFMDSRIADRYGRKISLFISVGLFTVGSLLSATSPNLGWLIFWRVISGMGIGAEIASVTTYMGELSPAAIRGRCTGWAIAAGFLGIAVVPFAALGLVPKFDWGWRILFVIGGTGGLILAFMRRHLPQSAHWLVARGRYQEAEEILKQAETHAVKKLGRELPPPPAILAETKPKIESFRHLFHPPYVGRLLLFAVVWFIYYVGNYAWLTLAPDLLTQTGFTLQKSIAFLTVSGTGFVVGAVAAALISDRMERKLATAIIATIWGFALLMIGYFPSGPIIMVFGFLASVSIGLLIPILYTYTAENFSTGFRATGVSVTDGVGHLGGAFCGQIVFAIEHSFGFSGAFTVMAITGFLTAILVSLGIKTTGRSLHNLHN